MRGLILGAVVLTLTACGTIEHYEEARQPLGKMLSAGVGDVVLRVDKTRDLTNIHGKADIWGRKTSTGFTEVRVIAIEPDGTIVLTRTDVEIHSNETTMTRLPFVPVPTTSTATYSGMVGRTPVTGQGASSGVTFVPAAPAATPIVLPPNSVLLRITPQAPGVQVGKYRLFARTAAFGIEYGIESSP